MYSLQNKLSNIYRIYLQNKNYICEFVFVVVYNYNCVFIQVYYKINKHVAYKYLQRCNRNSETVKEYFSWKLFLLIVKIVHVKNKYFLLKYFIV